MDIRCKQCNGTYVLREGRYGAFAGCTNFPRCKSTMKFFELVQAFIRERGINIYRWQRICWNCEKNTPVYSYFLDYELKELDEYLSTYGPIGLGDLEHIDMLLANEIPSIQIRHSNTTKSRYMANTCVHCSALQGRNYVVDDPHEIIAELWHDHNMKKYLYKTITLNDLTPLLSDLKRLYSDVE